VPRTLGQAAGFLLGFWIALVVFLGIATGPARGEPATSAEARLEADLHVAVNHYRAENHLILLERRADLDAVARAHSLDMVRRHTLSHESEDGGNWVDRLASARVSGFAMAGENVGLTSRSGPTDEILGGWIRSEVHRKNLVARPYNATGIGVARADDGTLYYTQLYLTFPR